jgi:Na+/H+ antiporter NhaD/arsenite permease-like protein
MFPSRSLGTRKILISVKSIKFPGTLMEIHQLAQNIPLFSCIPFILMLGAIAILPISSHHFWKHNKNKLLVALILGIPTAGWLIFSGFTSNFSDTMIFDYLPFIILLGSLFIITGGIFVEGDIEAKPIVNTTFLAIGAVLASFMGTTGAAMLLIRPLLHTNKERQYRTHTVLFFIAIVANCGGLLTPLGDPPLFMMYLRGASFFWFLNLLPEWLFVNLMLLISYYFVDSGYHKMESPEALRRDKTNIKPLRIEGKLNFLWLAGVILAVAFINENVLRFININHYFKFLREIVIILMALCSLLMTPRMTRISNSFTWEPIIEVAYLFLGVFITMIPCILYLESNANQLGINSPALFYYASGTLSSFLDNTPTAMTFYSLARGLAFQGTSLMTGSIVAGIPALFMKGISVGAVFFGAMTYIGNGPNFMVKSIAESLNVKMPHFFAYIFKFSLIVLLPLFILCQLIFIHY